MCSVTNPLILFLDEPTSGLDTLNAYVTCKLLRQIAHTGKTVVATLHQPSSEIFHMADDLILMSEGHIVYCGPVTESVNYFAEQGFVCPKYTNPADFFFMALVKDDQRLLSPDPAEAQKSSGSSTQQENYSVVEEQAENSSGLSIKFEEFELKQLEPPELENVVCHTTEESSLEKLIAAWPESQLGRKLSNLFDGQSEVVKTEGIFSDGETDIPAKIEEPPPKQANIVKSQSYATGFFHQFSVLMLRFWKITWRNPMAAQIRVLQIAVLVFLIDVVFWDIPSRDADAQIQVFILLAVC